jgi:hypothetical protein
MATYAGKMFDELEYEPYQVTFADIMPTKLTLRVPAWNYEAWSSDGYTYQGSYTKSGPDPTRPWSSASTPPSMEMSS